MEAERIAAVDGEKLREVLVKCRDRFEEYVASHYAKGTPDGNAKAIRNADMVMLIDEALATPPQPPTKIDELEQQMRDIIAASGGEAGLDAIIIELYRRHKVVQQRRFIMNKLYRMGQKGLIEGIEGKKGVYCIPSVPSSSGPNFDDDLEEVPF